MTMLHFSYYSQICTTPSLVSVVLTLALLLSIQAAENKQRKQKEGENELYS
jgi:hypothetical protein